MSLKRNEFICAFSNLVQENQRMDLTPTEYALHNSINSLSYYTVFTNTSHSQNRTESATLAFPGCRNTAMFKDHCLAIDFTTQVCSLTNRLQRVRERYYNIIRNILNEFQLTLTFFINRSEEQIFFIIASFCDLMKKATTSWRRFRVCTSCVGCCSSTLEIQIILCYHSSTICYSVTT